MQMKIKHKFFLYFVGAVTFVSIQSLLQFLLLAQDEATTSCKRLQTDQTSKVRRDDLWQTVHFRESKLAVYSAYFDTRYHPKLFVRIIAILRFDVDVPMNCIIKYSNRTVHNVGHFLEALFPSIPTLYQGAFLMCPVEAIDGGGGGGDLPLTVTIVQNLGVDPVTELTIQHRSEETPPLRKFAVCVKPVYDYHNTVKFIEWMELHKILGVEHFLFYNYSIEHDLGKVIQYYKREGIVSVYQWNVPFPVGDYTVDNSSDILTDYGHVASIQDCYLRSMHRYTWLLLIDLDEIIMPRQDFNYHQLLDRVKKEDGASFANYGALGVRNSFFYMKEPNDETMRTNKSAMNLMTALKTIRLKKIDEFGRRSKLIVRPERVEFLDIHFVSTMISGYTTKELPVETALLHHYREDFIGEDRLKEKVVDRSAHRFVPQLAENVKRVCEAVFENWCSPPPAYNWSYKPE